MCVSPECVKIETDRGHRTPRTVTATRSPLLAVSRAATPAACRGGTNSGSTGAAAPRASAPAPAPPSPAKPEAMPERPGRTAAGSSSPSLCSSPRHERPARCSAPEVAERSWQPRATSAPPTAASCGPGPLLAARRSCATPFLARVGCLHRLGLRAPEGSGAVESMDGG